tara:strand:+ start:2001 stop:2369 length:369 start_codon:yes stop_codon:yes gene_type:complete
MIGFGLGLLIVYVLFGDRELNTWTPQQRILTAIDSSEVSFSDRAICLIKCLQLQDNEWKEIQKTAKVDFSESATKRKPCPSYRLNATYREKSYVLIWEVCEKQERVKLLTIVEEGRSCDCPS